MLSSPIHNREHFFSRCWRVLHRNRNFPCSLTYRPSVLYPPLHHILVICLLEEREKSFSCGIRRPTTPICSVHLRDCREAPTKFPKSCRQNTHQLSTQVNEMWKRRGWRRVRSARGIGAKWDGNRSWGARERIHTIVYFLFHFFSKDEEKLS